MPSISETWGTTAAERDFPLPCDGIVSQPDAVVHRGVTINASDKTIFRWLCQMRVAPYSYDWIDNGGKQSPRALTPGLEKLAVGQEIMRIFELVDYEMSRHLTIRLKQNSRAAQTFGDIAVSYVIVPLPGSDESCRLLVRLIVKYPAGLRGVIWKKFLPWGDLVMMRRQLLNFKALAELTQKGDAS